VAARRIENDAAQRDDEHVAGIDRGVRNDTDENNHRRQQLRRRHVQQGADCRIDEAGVLCDADTHHGDQHHANRVEMREVRHHGRQEFSKGPGREQIIDDERLVRAWVDDTERDVGEQPRQHPDYKEQRDKQHRRVR
jgi:hypothetical protein